MKSYNLYQVNHVIIDNWIIKYQNDINTIRYGTKTVETLAILRFGHCESMYKNLVQSSLRLDRSGILNCSVNCLSALAIISKFIATDSFWL